MKSPEETETAFGRPASWLAASPAVVVGCAAFLLAVYGTWIMPRQLRPQYLSALESTRTEYQSLSSGRALSVSWKIGEVAGEMDVIYSRLVGLEGVDADRYWEWAEFLRSHANAVQRMLHNPAASVQPDTRRRLEEQAQQFKTKANDIVEQLAAGTSHLRATALLSMAQTQYETGIAETGVREPEEVIAELRELLPEVGTAPESDVGKLNSAQLESARLLLIQLMIEAAWQSSGDPGTDSGIIQSRLSPNEKWLQQAWELYDHYRPASLSSDTATQWQALGKLLAAMTGETQRAEGNTPQNNSPLNSAAVEERDVESDVVREDWQGQLAEFQLAAVEADWGQLSFLLSRHSEDRRAAVTTHLARTICRLACSPVARVPDAWADQCELGILLVVQVSPHLPETSELLWECGRHQSRSAPTTSGLSPLVPEAIVRGQSAALKHSISALSATQAGEATVARTHLQLILRAHAGLALVARTVLWRTQVLAPLLEDPGSGALPDREVTEELTRLTELMKAACELEPDSGLNWFTLGTLQFRTRQFDAMQKSLERAQTLLGDVPVIEQMLKATAHAPQQLPARRNKRR